MTTPTAEILQPDAPDNEKNTENNRESYADRIIQDAIEAAPNEELKTHARQVGVEQAKTRQAELDGLISRALKAGRIRRNEGNEPISLYRITAAGGLEEAKAAVRPVEPGR